ncbi:MAG: hypothetical protein MUO82_02550 [Candidatus Thermoplasmatota archaeon]|nr:hypothetical protein [Candidatus Thermoplasmatota archaeon]
MSIGQAVIANNQTLTETDSLEHIRDFIRGVKIDFTPPSVVLNSGSYFVLNVTLTRTRIRPMIFSIVVFMRLKDEFDRDHVVRIGSKPYVFFPVNNESIAVCIPCITQHEIASDVSCLFSGSTSKLNLFNGSIGVQINKGSRWYIDDIIWRKIFSTEKGNGEMWSQWSNEQTTQFISFLELICPQWKNTGTLFKFRLISILSNLGIKDFDI